MTLLSIIIPVYNSQETLALLQKNIEQKIENEYEIIFINDGSIDNSWQVIKDIATKKKTY